LNSQDYINKIIKYSARFVEEVTSYNALELYDINIHSENFFIPIFNQIFDLKLENLNKTIKKNYPSIDLADFKKRVSFQITATSTTKKIKETIEKFIRYNLDKEFDTLYIYIITEKKNNYSDAQISNLLPKNFHFTVKEHILDNNDLLNMVNGLAIEKLSYLAKIYEQEFSDIQIEQRHKKYRYGYLSSDEDKLILNSLQVKVPPELYIAELDIDEKLIQDRINEWCSSMGYRVKKRRMPKQKLIINELAHNKVMCQDWLFWEGKLFTFRDLSKSGEPLAGIVDKGTITEINSEDYYNQNENALRVFKNLLRNALREDCHSKGLEWVNKKELLRFKKDKDQSGSKMISWKGKHKAKKTVVTELINKKKGHVICNRHLAFHPAFELIDNTWFLIINSTWSFTNPDGRRTSRFEKDYLSGIKRLENNKSIYNFFRFWSYFLRYKDLFSRKNQILKFEEIFPFMVQPKLEDDKWLPAREELSQIEHKDAIIMNDDELTLNLFD